MFKPTIKIEDGKWKAYYPFSRIEAISKEQLKNIVLCAHFTQRLNDFKIGLSK